MIILKLGLCCRFLFPVIGSYKSKVVNFFFYTVVIPLVMYLFLLHSNSQPNLFPSYGIILITLVVLLWTPTIYARYQRSYWSKFSLYSLRLSLLLLFLYMVFSRQSLLTLFVFFELSLVPIIAILFIGGSSHKKLEAGLYMFAFTSSSAFIFLVFLVFIRLSQNGINHFLFTTTSSYNSPLKVVEIHVSTSMLIYNLATIVILVKTPLFFVHIWLPKAHVEAPVFASIILARLLLKTGGYGYLIVFMNYFGVLVQYNYSVCRFLLMYPFLIFLFLINYILIGYYSCLILVKLMLSTFPTNVGRLIGVGLTPYMCNTVVLMHFLVLINITICYPWLR